MTARRRLVPMAEVREALDTLKAYGIDVSACRVDIRSDGVAITPPAATSGNSAYDAWKAKDKNRDRPASRQ